MFLDIHKTPHSYVKIEYFPLKMLFITSIISILTFRGSTICEYRALETILIAGLMAALHPLPRTIPFLPIITNAVKKNGIVVLHNSFTPLSIKLNQIFFNVALSTWLLWFWFWLFLFSIYTLNCTVLFYTVLYCWFWFWLMLFIFPFIL